MLVILRISKLHKRIFSFTKSGLINEIKVLADAELVLSRSEYTTSDTVMPAFSFIINCQKYNSSVILDNSDDIIYLYRLAQDAPLLYAELALKADGLQGYVDAMIEFN